VQAVESVPDRVGGAWVFKGTRLPVATIIENLEDLSVEEVIEQFDVTRKQVTAVLEFVAETLRSEGPAGADHGTPKELARLLTGHTIHTSLSRGWHPYTNGALLNAAEEVDLEKRP
jgi:uncharacterized protein (DUF433 family)